MKQIFNLHPKRSPVLALMLAMILSVSMITVSCNADWLPKVTGYINTFVPIAANIAQLILLFNPGGIPADLSTEIRKFLGEASADAQKLSDLVTEYQALSASDPSKPGKLKDINNLLTVINTNLTSIFPLVHIANADLQKKILDAVALLVASLHDIAGLIPGVVVPVISPIAKQHILHARTAAQVKFKSGEQLKRAFNTLMTTPTASPEVDKATAGLTLK